MAYPDAAALIASASGPGRAALDDLDALQVEGLRQSAIAAVEQFCGQRFGAAVPEQRQVDAYGGVRLSLPERLETITALSFPGAAGTLENFELSADHATLTMKPRTAFGAIAQAMAEVDPGYWGPGRFPEGEGAVIIAGSWGWSECPPAVAAALGIDIGTRAVADSSTLAASVAAYRAMGLKSIRQGRLSAELGPDASGLTPAAANLLLPYVWHASGRSV